jgi:ribose transport system ATP-binding protein
VKGSCNIRGPWVETGITHSIILEARAMVKDFSGQRALDGVDFDVRAGEVHALIGENGAGKSTLIKIIAGVFRADSGEILLDGKPVYMATPRDSQDLGLAFIHQDLNVVPHLSVAENIFLGRYPKNALGLVRVARMADLARAVPEAVPIKGDLRRSVGELPLIEQWKTVINRALALKSRIIFMDEPTTSLTYSEVDELFNAIVHLKERGKAIVYVSHRMEEIFKLADRVTVIKDAKNVGTAAVSLLKSGQLYSMMLGRELEDIFPAKDPPRDEVCLEVKNLSRGRAVRDVSFQLRQGEILGLAGLVGSGRTELARLLFGADRKDRGDILINGDRAASGSPRDAIRRGIGLVPEQRHTQGLVLPMDVKENITLASLKKLWKSVRLPFLSRRKETTLAAKFVITTGVKAYGLGQPVSSLSGGNQQKVVLSKWLCAESSVLILDEPTKGIDVGAKFALYRLITDLAREGKAIVVISSDLIEVVGLCHRIIVLSQGRIKADLKREETDLPSLLSLCLGKGTMGLETSTN